MNAGPELDALIATKVMGWTRGISDVCNVLGWRTPDSIWVHDADGVPHYSTDIAAAWEVVEQLKAHKDYVSFGLTDDSNSSTATFANFEGVWFAGFGLGVGGECVGAATAPLAICLAALKAIGG